MKIFSAKNKIVLVSILIAVGTISGLSLVNKPQSAGAEDSPLMTQVDNQGKQLANHEARITTAENNIQDIKSGVVTTTVATHPNNPAAPEQVPAPVINTPDQAVTVTSYREIPVDNGNDCELTYSDGSTHQFHWKTISYGTVLMTDGNGQNGHPVVTTQTNISGRCDDSLVGTPKSN